MTPPRLPAAQPASPILDVMLVLLAAWMLFVFKSLWPSTSAQPPKSVFACELPSFGEHARATRIEGVTWEQVPIEIPPPDLRAERRRGRR